MAIVLPPGVGEPLTAQPQNPPGGEQMVPSTLKKELAAGRVLPCAAG